MRRLFTFKRNRGAIIATTAVAALVFASSASGATITSTGPLTSIGVSEDLNCSVNHTGDVAGEFFDGTACGTFVTVGTSHYGPASVPAGISGNPPYTPFSQSAVTGSGTTADPYTIVTAVDLGTSGLRLTETDSYVVGQESYRTDVQIHNNSSESIDAIVYRAADCYLQNSDSGFGSVDSATGAVACVSAVLNESGELVPGPRIEQWFPLSAGSHYYENAYNSVWAATVSGSAFPDTCACTQDIDNGAGLSWNVTLPAGGSVTRSSIITFSPLGHSPLSTTKTADSASATPGGTDGYTITISDPNTSSVSLTSITDTLPAGFSYTAGSSTGATTTDPAVSGQTLTWAGPINVPAASNGISGTVTLHFGVTASGSSGTYFNNAGGTSAEFTIVPTGDTAPVTVSGQPPSSTSLSTSLSGGGQSGGNITVPEGTAVTDSARLGGENAGIATGEVSYTVYSDEECTREVASAGEVEVSAGTVPDSNAVTLAPGTYYWQASYTGDEANKASKSECPSEQLTVASAVSGPRQEKEAVLAELEALLPSGNRDADNRITKAIQDIKESLDPKLWIDGSHLTAKKGEEVFQEEHEAVEHLRNINGPAAGAVSGLVMQLVEIDRTLAQTAIDEATDPKAIAEATKEMEKAAPEIAKGMPQNAIEHYKQAWKKATKA